MVPFQQFIQIVSAVLGLIVALFKAGKDAAAFLKDRKTAQSPELNEGPRKAAQAHRNILDLSLSFLIAAFFTLVLLDALVVSGRYININLSIGLTILITIVLTISFLLSWLTGKLEQTIGIFSLIIFFVVIFSPGGPFYEGDNGGASGISLWIPVFALILLSTTMIIYSYGNPFDKKLPTRKRYYLGTIFIFLLVSGSLSLGLSLRKIILSDPILPKLDSFEETAAVDNFKKIQNIDNQRNLFKLISEDDLQKDYVSNFGTVNAEFFSPDTVQISAPDVPKVVVDGKEYTSTDKNAEFDQGETKERKEKLDQLFGYFSRMDILTKQNYLSERLKLIYPIGNKTYERPIIDIPGNTSFDRIKGLQLIKLGCYNNIEFSSKKSMLDLFYNANIIPTTVPHEDYTDFTDAYAGPPVPKRRKRDIYVNNADAGKLVEPLSSKVYVAKLNEQLILPYNYEMYLAYREYEDLADDLLNDHFKDKADKKVALMLVLDSLRSLKPDIRTCFQNYIISDTLGKVYTIISDNIDAFSRYITPIIRNSDILQTIADSADNKSYTGNDTSIARAVEFLINIERTDASKYQDIINLFRTRDPANPIQYLFNKECIDIVSEVKRKFDTKERIYIFRTIDKPIRVSINSFVKQNIILDTSFSENINAITNLGDSQKIQIVNRCAMSVFNSGGPYSPDILSLMVYNADSGGQFWGAMISSLLCSPYIFLSLLLGNLIARRLIIRDNLRKIVLSEEKYGLEKKIYTTGEPTSLKGRNAEIKKVLDLAGRGWSSIAIVGRRGIGKSRILLELYKNSFRDRSNLSVWVSAPSQYTEEDFIQNVFEQVINSVDNKITKIVGCQPYEVRRLEKKSVDSAIQIFAIFLTLTIAVFTLMQEYGRIPNTQIISSWFPIAILMLTSVTILGYKAITIQPIDLSSWLERDKANNPHSALLYRETIKAKDFLNSRQAKPRQAFIFKMKYVIAVLSALFVIMLFFLAGARLVNRVDLIVLLIIFFVILAFIWYSSRQSKDQSIFLGNSLMSLVTQYRSYLDRVVLGIKSDALGTLGADELPIIICIDELDKIVSETELRNFIRRIKILFEIPGVYYYLSLSEDSLNSMYLGVATGKNEIDSAFDHIVFIPHLQFPDSKEVAQTYLKNNMEHTDKSISDTVATDLALISFGIPRDILRRCDEYLSNPDIIGIENKNVEIFKCKLATLSFNEGAITYDDFIFFTINDDMTILKEFNLETFNRNKPSKIKLTFFLLSLMSYIAHGPEKNKIIEDYNVLMELGYEIGGNTLLDLISTKFSSFLAKYDLS